MTVLTDLSKDERSLLLFFETNAVDQGGAIDMRHMNAGDRAIAARWVIEGFIEFGRIAARSLPIGSGGRTHYVVLGSEALALAQEERRARIKRLDKSRTWQKAGEE